MNSLIGQILLWCGFLSGALATVFATGNYGRLGITVSDAADPARVIVDAAAEGGSGFEAGIRTDDELLSFNGEAIDSAAAFSKRLGGFESDQPAEIVIRRGDEERQLNVSVPSSWTTVNWIWYLVSALVCVSGVVFLRSGKRSRKHIDARSEAGLKQIKAHLADAVHHTEVLNDGIGDYKPRQILNYIEDQLLDDLRGFADGRDTITHEYGLEIFAEVMTQFASGERAINRAWSAAADGYVEEAARCVDHGLAMLKSAQKILLAASQPG
jgi:hypothetical protein